MSVPVTDVRGQFVNYFEGKKHTAVTSSALVPMGDPTLLFTNAGMVQFKDVFTGAESRDYKRAVSVQKCLRVGGKHNDLENVGHTARHHTFFEMLGNFSFGDYFKKDAIAFAWEFVTQVVGLPKDKLCVTIFKGEEGIAADEEAAQLWAAQGVAPERIIRLGMKDNFWSMGDTGACGPCSEIHYYQGALPTAEALKIFDTPAAEDQWIEIWNLVFMQFERKANGTLIPLPNPSIDTGMGLERLTAILEGKANNFDSSLFAPIIERISQITGRRYHANSDDDAAMRVIADHARAATFLVADNVLPGAEGRNYVLRRLIRRAMRYAYKLGYHKPIVCEAAKAVIASMGHAYPEIRAEQSKIDKFIREEEERFLGTIASGMERLNALIADARARDRGLIGGEDSFRLYDTYGFPIDLTALVVREQGLRVDMAGFETAMEAQRERARAAGTFAVDENAFAALEKNFGATRFLGYSELQAAATIKYLCIPSQVDQSLDRISHGSVLMVVDQTPIYAESGGQVADHGQVLDGSGHVLGTITDCQKTPGGLFVHSVDFTRPVAVGEPVSLQVDTTRRAGVRRNHTATHLLQHALRNVLGSHVQQSGSLVEPNRLRFDFSHNGPLTAEQRERIESMVEEMIRADYPTDTRQMALKAAMESGAMAFFGDKYGSEVRVVSVGPSKELCGGTHVRSTGEIGGLTIVGESGIASGVRRVEARVGPDILAYYRSLRSTTEGLADHFGVPVGQLAERGALIADELKALRKAQQKAAAAASLQKISDWKNKTQMSKYGPAVILELSGVASKDLRTAVDSIRSASADTLVVAVSTNGENCDVIVSQREPHNGFSAGAALKNWNQFGLRGGGKADLAQGGGLATASLGQWLALVRADLGL